MLSGGGRWTGVHGEDRALVSERRERRLWWQLGADWRGSALLGAWFLLGGAAGWVDVARDPQRGGFRFTAVFFSAAGASVLVLAFAQRRHRRARAGPPARAAPEREAPGRGAP